MPDRGKHPFTVESRKLAFFVFHCTRFFDTEGWHLCIYYGKFTQLSKNLGELIRGIEASRTE